MAKSRTTARNASCSSDSSHDIVQLLVVLDPDHGIAPADLLARTGEHLGDDAVDPAGQRVLHLHRLDDGQRLPGVHRVADRDADVEHRCPASGW